MTKVVRPKMSLRINRLARTSWRLFGCVARQRLRRMDRATGERTCSASPDCIVRTVSFGPDPLEAYGDRLGQGEYECSTRKIDALCDTLNATPGVLGSQLVGAGLGGCIIALVEKSASSSVLTSLALSGYTAFSCEPSFGSKVEY